MAYNELRRDFLLDRWVVIATERARRPTDFIKAKTDSAKTQVCPLCPGNEQMTPPATLVYLPENEIIRKDEEQGNYRHKNWLIRSIPNMFPAFSAPKRPEDTEQIIENENFGHAIGHHEVIVETPIHSDHPANAPVPQTIHLINAYKDRLRDLAKKPYVRHVQIFRNHGIEAGASLSHAHSQIIATPFAPTIVKSEFEASKQYHTQHGTCCFCDLIKRETATQRAIAENKHFAVLAPFASVHPMEFWIIPKHHDPSILGMTYRETEAFAATLKETLAALKFLVNDPPYNFGIHLAIDKNAQPHYHWHLEVYPHLAIWA
jgi:UDPglucose--hexose-1-phosphate uridylyltransferase